jgi:hypothetical protein
MYKLCRTQVDEGKKTASSMWNLVKIDDLYLDNCFDDINNRLHRVPGAVHKETRDLYGPNAFVSLLMSREDMTINLFKTTIDTSRNFLSSSNSTALFLECVLGEKSKDSPPLYISEIVDNYRAEKIVDR